MTNKQKGKRQGRMDWREWAVALGPLALLAIALAVYWGLLLLRPEDTAAQASAATIAEGLLPLAIMGLTWCLGKGS